MKRYIKLYGLFISQFIKTLMQSKADFFIGFVAFFLIQSSGILFVYLIFKQIPSLEGWVFYEMLFIYGFAQIPRGIDHIFTDQLWLLAGRSIVRGEFDRYLLRPLNPLFQLIAERLQPDGIGEVVIGIILIVISSIQLDISYGPIQIIAMILMVVCGAFLYASIKLLFASFAFWLKRSQSILFMFYMTSDFSKYPIVIYSKGIQVFVKYIVPFALTAFIPASYFLGENGLLETLGLIALVTVIFMFVSYTTFTKGLKQYESVGN